MSQIAITEKEALILATVLQDKRLRTQVGALLDPSNFTPKNKTVFETIRHLLEKSSDVSGTSVLYELSESGGLQEVGGAERVRTLDQIKAVDEPTFIRLCEEIKRASEVRTLKGHFASLTQVDDEIEPDALIQKAVTGLYTLTGFRDEGIVDIDTALAQAENTKRVPHVKTGLKDLDEYMYGGISDTDYIVLGARPSSGKTVLASQIALMGAKNGKGVLFFSLEQSRASLVRRLQKMLPKGLAGLPLLLNCQAGITADKIFYQAQLAKLTHDIKLVVIDYIQLIGGQPSGLSRNDFLGGVSQKLRVLANKLGVAVLAVSQLSRENMRTNDRPQLHHLRETGSLEQDADMVWFIHRRPDQEIGEFILAKWREGEVGDFRVRFDNERLIFTAAKE